MVKMTEQEVQLRFTARAVGLLALLMLAVLAYAPAVHAQTPEHGGLRSAIQVYESGDFPRAMQLMEAIQPSSLSSRDQAIRDLFRGFIFLAYGDETQAEGAMESAVSLDATVRPDPALHSPSRLEFFERVRSRVISRPAATLYGLGPNAQVLIDGRPPSNGLALHRESDSARIVFDTPGVRSVSIQEPGFLSLGFLVSPGEGEEVFVEIDMGPPRPNLLPDTAFRGTPARPVPPERPPRPNLLSTASEEDQVARLRGYKRRMTWEYRFDVLGTLVFFTGWGTAVEFGESDEATASFWGGMGLGLLLGRVANPTQEIRDYCTSSGRKFDKGECRTLLTRDLQSAQTRLRAVEARNAPALADWSRALAEWERQRRAGFPQHSAALRQWEVVMAEVEEQNRVAEQARESNRIALEEWERRVRSLNRQPRIWIVHRR